MKPAILMTVMVILAAQAYAQPAAPPTFSVDNASPATGAIPANGADILAPVPPAPGIPAVPPLPAPGVVIVSGVGGLNLAAPGGGFPEVDALSYGNDPAPMDSLEWYFSVDRSAIGITGVGPLPTVTTEGARLGAPPGGGAKEASADVFLTKLPNAGPIAPPVAPPAPYGNNTGFYDGNGLISASGAVYPGLGLNSEPNPNGDRLDAFDLDVTPGAQATVYYSLDAATAAANAFQPGDVLVTTVGVGGPAAYANAVQLGLDNAGPGSDDLDAMVLWEDGDGIFTPGSDVLLFSITAASNLVTTNTKDSLFNVQIEPGDILCDPTWAAAFGGIGPAGNPGIYIPAEELGLETLRSYNGADELDALDVPEPTTMVLLAFGGLVLIRRRRRK